jgi:uncharacterized protein
MMTREPPVAKTNGHIPANLFNPKLYVRSEIESGLLETRQGRRLISLPDTLIHAMYSALERETGQAARLVLFNVGLWWGKEFYKRLNSEIQEYYGQSIAQMSMTMFELLLSQAWIAHGWGRIYLDMSLKDRGLVQVTLKHSTLPGAANRTEPTSYLEQGILKSFFAELTGRDLGCVQSECTSTGHPHNRFIITLAKRLDKAEAWMSEGMSHDEMIARLTAS